MVKQVFLTLLVVAFAQGCSYAGNSKTEKPLVVMMMADPQFNTNPKTPVNIKTAMDDIVSLDYDFMAVLGDLVQHKAAYYKDYNEMIVKRSVKPVYPLAGNGDLTPQQGPGTNKRGLGTDGYKKGTGFELYYSVYKQGVRFIFLSVVDISGNKFHICHLGDAQMKWLKKELAKDTVSTTVIFAHPPIFETTWQSGPLEAPMYLYESKQMRELFSKYPNIKIYAHGHMHITDGAVNDKGQGCYFKEGNVLHISVGSTMSNKGSSVLYISRDEITVKVRDHEHHQWRDEYEYRYPVKTTLNSNCNKKALSPN